MSMMIQIEINIISNMIYKTKNASQKSVLVSGSKHKIKFFNSTKKHFINEIIRCLL